MKKTAAKSKVFWDLGLNPITMQKPEIVLGGIGVHYMEGTTAEEAIAGGMRLGYYRGK